jgi:phospholipase/carboxylesterase
MQPDFPLHSDLPLSYRARESAAGEGAPLLLLLHGVGSNELDLLGLEPLLDERFHLVSARAPRTYAPGFAWFDISFTPELVPNMEQAEESNVQLSDFIDALGERYRVPARRIFLMGFSQGAIMGFGVALRTPGKVGGLIAMSGRLAQESRDEMAPDEALAGLPVLITHGIYDQVLPVWHARNARSVLERLPVSLEYHEYPMGHEVSQASMADIVDWLRRHAFPEERPGD